MPNQTMRFRKALGELFFPTPPSTIVVVGTNACRRLAVEVYCCSQSFQKSVGGGPWYLHVARRMLCLSHGTAVGGRFYPVVFIRYLCFVCFKGARQMKIPCLINESLWVYMCFVYIRTYKVSISSNRIMSLASLLSLPHRLHCTAALQRNDLYQHHFCCCVSKSRISKVWFWFWFYHRYIIDTYVGR